MHHRSLILTCVALLFVYVTHAQTDTAALRAASGMQKSIDKISALEQFVQKYPTSGLLGSAYHSLFSLYLDQKSESPALQAAHKYIESLSSDDLMNAYNSVAYEMALQGIGLDSALAYATRAEDMARGQNANSLTAIQDTRAYVLYLKGDAAGAEQLQQQAIIGHENDPDYVSHLALFQEGNGKRREALRTLCRAMFMGSDPELKARFTEWLAKEEADSSARDALKQSIVMSIVRASLDTVKGERVVRARSKAAVFMADLGVHTATAKTWAEEGSAALRKDSPLEEVIRYRENLALVQYDLGMYPEALASLQSLETIVSPWDSEYWLKFGRTYEQVGEPAKAIDAYMQGLVMINQKEIRAALEKAYARVHGNSDGLDADLNRLKQADANFQPGAYQPDGHRTERVVLAELFTGAECGPCLGSDLAYDALSKYYPTSSVAILEYHVHVPGPDPMTTNESWKRFQMYGGNGTPTAVINGRDVLVGGGPRAVARNRFNLYRYAIDRSLSQEPDVHLSMAVDGRDGKVDVKAEVENVSRSARPRQPVLHIALVERSVDYAGSNGVAKHAFVVRMLFTGTPLRLGESSEKISAQINLADVESGMKKLLDNPKAEPSWPKHLKKFSGWRAQLADIDPSNLAVVAWVQDLDGSRVLQAAYQDVHWAAPESQRAAKN